MNGEAEDKVNILLVDDQEDGLTVLEAILSPLRQNLVTARSGAEALRQMLALDFAAVILDVQMPGMDGFEVANIVRKREKTKSTPLIFLTAGHRTEASVFRGYAAGAVDYLFKPVEPEILKSKVSVFVDLARKTELVRRQADALAAREAEARVLVGTLEQKNRALDALNKEIESFSYSVSHDLRAPLRGLDGFSQALLADYDAKLDDHGRTFLHYIRDSAHKMSALIDGLLVLSRVTRSEVNRESVDLSVIASRVASRLQGPEPTRRAEFVIAEGLVADGDARLLEAVLENLLGNAWKFTRRCDVARIEVGRTRVEGVVAYFVKDNGAGFDAKYAKKLFGAFQRLHSDAEFEGHGIGLATVQRIVHRHGGQIWAEGVVDEGAKFTFTLGEGE
ncbi:MAG: response regulator [Deltaproteobacteria bacterium]|nr:response regulator [Deltaproteobacteria bacterium]